jgi:hypothetical protein
VWATKLSLPHKLFFTINHWIMMLNMDTGWHGWFFLVKSIKLFDIVFFCSATWQKRGDMVMRGRVRLCAFEHGGT